MEVLKKQKFSIVVLPLLLLFFVATILPARFFQIYSLTAVPSSVSCNYLNYVDLLYAFLFVISFSFLLFSKRGCSDGLVFVPCFFSLVSFFCTLFLLFSGYSEFIPDLISKTVIIWSSYFLSLLIKLTKSEALLERIFFLLLFTLCFISLFLSSYGSYAVENRSGTSGFGINESALFASALFACVLFSPKKSFWDFLFSGIGALVALLSLILSSSRRGLIVSAAIFAIFIFEKFFQFLSYLSKKRGKSFSAVILVMTLFLAVIVCFSFRTTIYALLLKSATFRRMISSASGGDLFGDDRLQIYDYAISSLSDYWLFGFYGSDKFFANVVMGANVHCHNVFLELVSVFGVPIGSIFSIFFLIVFSRSLMIFLDRKKHFSRMLDSMISPPIFLLVYFVFDFIGYSLWNPKMLFLVLFCSFLVLSRSSFESHADSMVAPSLYRGAVIQSKKEK